MFKQTVQMCVLAGLLLGTSSALAQDGTNNSSVDFRKAGKFGLGLGAGSLTAGISGKYWLSDTSALQFVVGGTYGYGYGGLGLSADYLIEMPALVDESALSITWNVGAGVGVNLYNGGYGSALGLNAVGGLEFNIKELPIEFVLEYRPGFYFYGGNFWTNFGSASAHARWYF